MAQPVQVVSGVLQPSYSFTRPGNTTQYAAGDLVANNTSAASVVAMSWDIGSAENDGRRSIYLPGIRLHKSDKDLVSASFKVHIYKATPTFTSAGDNGVFSTVVATGNAHWLGSYSGTFAASHADGDSVVLTPDSGVVNPLLLSEQVVASPVRIYGLIEALGTYTPADSEVFTAELLLETN